MRPGALPDLWNLADLRKPSVRRPGPCGCTKIKHDGYRLLVRPTGALVRCFTRGGHDWADRFPAIVEAAMRLRVESFLIDGEAVVCPRDGLSDFNALRNTTGGNEV